MADLRATIEELWDNRAELAADDADANHAILEAITLLDTGEARVAEIGPSGEVIVHQWLKQAILLYFKQAKMETIDSPPFEYADKIPLKSNFEAAGVRVVPGAGGQDEHEGHEEHSAPRRTTGLPSVPPHAFMVADPEGPDQTAPKMTIDM